MQPAPTATPYFENVVERWATSGIIQIDLACEWALLEKSSRELGNSRNQQQLACAPLTNTHRLMICNPLSDV